MTSIVWDRELAEVYDQTYRATFEPSVLGPMVDLLARLADGCLVRHSAPYRYVWPSELDLMARITGFRLRDRWADWHRAPFTSDSQSQVAMFERLR